MLFRSLVVAVLPSACVVAQTSIDLQTPACAYAFPPNRVVGGDPEDLAFNGVMTLDVPPVRRHRRHRERSGHAVRRHAVPERPVRERELRRGPLGGAISKVFDVARVLIPIPAGANAVSLCWELNTPESVNSGFNGAVAVDVVPACAGGMVPANLVYADTDIGAWSPSSR
jgi:hypothetical protein